LEERANTLRELRERREEENDVVAGIVGGLCLGGFIALMAYCAAPGPPTCTAPEIVIPGSLLLLSGGASLYVFGLSLAALPLTAA
jgi:hypothetical protein